MPHTGCHGVAVATSLNYSVPQVPSPALPGSTKSRKRRKRKKKKSPQTIKVILASSEQAKVLVPFGRTRAAQCLLEGLEQHMSPLSKPGSPAQ